MHSIITSLSSNGIQQLNVFYDTLFINIKTLDDNDALYYNYLLIAPFELDYDTNIIQQSNSIKILPFGSSTTSDKLSYETTGVVDCIEIPNKNILICGLSSTCPVIKEYNLNTSKLNTIFDNSNIIWDDYEIGQIDADNRTLVHYNGDNNTLTYVIPNIFETEYQLSIITFHLIKKEIIDFRKYSDYDNNFRLVKCISINDGKIRCMIKSSSITKIVEL